MIRRLLSRFRPAATPAAFDLDRDALEKELIEAGTRVADLEREVRHLRAVNEQLRQADTAPLPAITLPGGPVRREDYLRERETSARLAGDVHRLTMASIARDMEER